MVNNKMFIQCTNCNHNFYTSPMLGIPEGMYYNGYRVIDDLLYCPDCVEKWEHENNTKFDEHYTNSSKMFANWWNSKVENFVVDKNSIKKYRIVNGIYEEV